MALSWIEIRSWAIRFSKEWENLFEEDAQAIIFLDQFFEVFGIKRRCSLPQKPKVIDLRL